MRRIVFTALVGLSLGLSGALTGCASGNNTGSKHPSAALGPVTPVQVADAEFGRSVHQLLLNGTPSQERLNLLVGVVQKQLAYSQFRFESGHVNEGVAALKGAIFLVRTGELRTEMFTQGTASLQEGASAAAQVGNEGRARALYGLLLDTLPPGKSREQVEQHLKALSEWTEASYGSGNMRALKGQQFAKAEQSLFAPSEQTLGAAHDATRLWVETALNKNLEDMPMEDNADRDEAVSVFQAVRTGSFALAALYLRHGDAAGAVEAIETSDVEKVTPPPLLDALRAAAKDSNPDAWAALLELYTRAEISERPETAISSELAAAAAWGCAVQFYRTEPDNLQSAGTLATLLMRYGMSEAAPEVLASAIEADATGHNVSVGMALVLKSIVDADEIGDLAAARRTFDSAERLFKLADSPKLQGKVQPSPARLRYVMGALETRSGELTRARPYVEQATQAEPGFEGFQLLASIDRQRKAYDTALQSIEAALKHANQEGNKFAETHALSVKYELLTLQGKPSEAGAALEAALKTALDARRLARSNTQLSEAERQLARILEYYGDSEGARRASRRAFEAAGNDTYQLTRTVLDSARRALTLRDLRAGREALKAAIDANLSDMDIIYVALWLQLLERQLKAQGDGLTEEALVDSETTNRWGRLLRAWGNQQLSDAELLSSAKNRVEKAEASFYAAFAGGTPNQTLLKEVAESEAIDLVEVTIARDLLRRAEEKAPPSLPQGISIP